MTNIIFLDEQEASIYGEKFTAVAGFSISTSEHIKLRECFYGQYGKILGTEVRDEGVVRIGDTPVMHGSSFLPEYDDDLKFRVMDHLFACLAVTNCKFYRIGYFNESIPKPYSGSVKQYVIDLCWSNIWRSLENDQNDHVLVHEFDKEALRKKLKSITESISKYYAIGQENISVPLNKMVGHYYSPKSELGCQIADLILYIALKNMTANSDFSRTFGGYLDRITDRFIINEVIWVNDPDKSHRFAQTFDKSLRKAFAIKPKD